jgi:uncharacterized glyoxalase superfamily protein PhnB
MDRRVIHTRHVLAVHDIAAESEYYTAKLGFEHDFSAPGWEFLSFGAFKVMLGECADALSPEATGDHSYFAHVLVGNVDEVYAELVERGALIIHPVGNKPWGLREFSVRTPGGHRITFGQLIEQ